MSIWFIARGAGLSALVLLSLSTVLGALVSQHGPATRRYVVQYLHRAAAGLGLTVLALHIATILADSYAHVGWLGALVPFTSGYRPTWVALGTLAAYVFIGVAVLGLARGRMAATRRGAVTWRGLHGLAYLGWFSAMWHGFLSGSDSSTGWVRALYVACLVAVLASIAWRVTTLSTLRSADRTDRFAGRPAPITSSRVSANVPATHPTHSQGALR